MIKSAPKIDILPEHLIDQIKAGEVIERPGNLLKEILENAIDAGATKIELIIKNNGLDLISLKDNGHGMKLEDLPLAFSRHATSKISKFEDLYKLHSFGFRGEALASIAAISKLQCVSQTTDGKVASELRIEGGHTLYHGQRQTSSGTHGTELLIQELFFNTPARLKFIQSQQAEKTFIKKIIFSFILSNPGTEFQIKIDDGDKDIFPARTTIKERIEDIFPKAKEKIQFSERFYENNELSLFLIPSAYKGPVRIQYIYINNRYVLDKQLHRVLSNALDASFSGEDFHYVCHFHLPPETIDVNVHPNKTIIKCLEISKMISLLSSTIKEMAAKKGPSPGLASSSTHAPSSSTSSDFFSTLGGATPSLRQERHAYNMEGQFSPHELQTLSEENLIWLGSYFLKKDGQGSWLAASAQKLLNAFTKYKLAQKSITIPLLVSEPFPAKDIKSLRIQELIISGLEIENLGPDTLVLRGIPEWMNGFPLKEVTSNLLQEKDFSHFEIHPNEWSESTWEEMLFALPMPELIKDKIVLYLESLLKEKLK